MTVRRSKCWKVDQWNSRWWSRKFLNSKVVARNFFVSLRAFEWYQNYKIWPRKPPWNIIRSWLHHLMRRIIKFVSLKSSRTSKFSFSVYVVGKQFSGIKSRAETKNFEIQDGKDCRFGLYFNKLCLGWIVFEQICTIIMKFLNRAFVLGFSASMQLNRRIKTLCRLSCLLLWMIHIPPIWAMFNVP